MISLVLTCPPVNTQGNSMPNPKILVVDDEANIRNLVTSYLQAEGYEYFTAADGPTALKRLKRFALI